MDDDEQKPAPPAEVPVVNAPQSSAPASSEPEQDGARPELAPEPEPEPELEPEPAPRTPFTPLKALKGNKTIEQIDRMATDSARKAKVRSRAEPCTVKQCAHRSGPGHHPIRGPSRRVNSGPRSHLAQWPSLSPRRFGTACPAACAFSLTANPCRRRRWPSSTRWNRSSSSSR